MPEAGNDLHQEHYSIKQYITKSFFMKGVRRQRNTSCILALSVSRMMIMILFHHYHHQNGRTLRQKNGGEHRKPSCDSFPEERQKRGTTCTRSTIHFNRFRLNELSCSLFRDEFAWVLGRG